MSTRAVVAMCSILAAVGTPPVFAQERPGVALRVAAGLSQVYVDEQAFPMVSASVRLPLSTQWSIEPEVRRDSHRDFGRTVVVIHLTHQSRGRWYVSAGAGRSGTDRFGADPGFATAIRVGWRFRLAGGVSLAPEIGGGFPGFVVGGVSVAVGGR